MRKPNSFSTQCLAASAAHAAEAGFSCRTFNSSSLLSVLDAIILASIFVVSLSVRIIVLALILSVILVLREQDRANRWKTQAAMAR